mmetsp:Transcript_37292/g.93620  ORF Transcript_37292/g.93620 Transcript_37292/m.93620 type:complete len:94 (+) Transcript_37292:117-398(+)
MQCGAGKYSSASAPFSCIEVRVWDVRCMHAVRGVRLFDQVAVAMLMVLVFALCVFVCVFVCCVMWEQCAAGAYSTATGALLPSTCVEVRWKAW